MNNKQLYLALGAFAALAFLANKTTGDRVRFLGGGVALAGLYWMISGKVGK